MTIESKISSAELAIPPIHQWTDDQGRVLLVKCVNRDCTSHDGFVWPKSGPVTPKVWSREPTCESGGLFGWPWGMGIGDGRIADSCAPWLVFAAKPENVIAIGDKAKVVPGDNGELPKVIYYGSMAEAMYLTSKYRVAWVQARSNGSASATGSNGSASATGYNGSASATGSRGSASATGDSGSASATGSSGSASATGSNGSASATGYNGSASATGDSGSASATGDNGSASATGYSGSAIATGDRGSASATGEHCLAFSWGLSGKSKAGKSGAVCVSYWDDKSKRLRVVIGYVGENGIEEDVWYAANKSGELVRVEQ